MQILNEYYKNFKQDNRLNKISTKSPQKKRLNKKNFQAMRRE